MSLAHAVQPFEARLVLMPQEHVAEVWPMAAPWLKKAEAQHSVWSVEEWLGQCVNGKAQLWFLWADNDECEGAGITSIVDTPHGRVCVIDAFSAKRGNDDLLLTVEAWARTQNCMSVRVFGRIGWMKRLSSYKPIGVILDREL